MKIWNKGNLCCIAFDLKPYNTCNQWIVMVSRTINHDIILYSTLDDDDWGPIEIIACGVGEYHVVPKAYNILSLYMDLSIYEKKL